jgi:acetyltransferase-like isoleucine patch superfamily enzyme
MLKNYIIGYLKNFFHSGISRLSLIDNVSIVSKDARLYRFCKIINSEVGAYTYIAPETTIVHCKIGRFCSIASQVKIGLGKHMVNCLSTSPVFYSRKNALGISLVEEEVDVSEFEDVVIGHDVWIGTGAIIMGGVKIGNGSIIGAGAIVTRDTLPYSINVGVPSRMVKFRFSEDVSTKLLESNWWDSSLTELKKVHRFFTKTDISVDDIFEVLTKLKSGDSLDDFSSDDENRNRKSNINN